MAEKDTEGGIDQAYGYAILGGHEQFSEFGYISIAELVSQRVELDLHFTPKPLIKILASRGARRLR